MENVFRALDVNREGEVDRTSLGIAFKKLGLGLSDDEVDAIMSDIDVNSDGSIELEEFEDQFSQQDPVAIFLDAQYEVYAKKRIELGESIFKAIDLEIDLALWVASLLDELLTMFLIWV